MWFWKRKKEVVADISVEPAVEVNEAAQPDPEKALAEALSRYERYQYERVTGAADQSATEARDIVRKANEFVSESRISYALCRAVYDHVQHWPPWSRHDDFSKYCVSPFEYIDEASDSGKKPSTTTVTFSYLGQRYTIRLIDEDMFSWADDSNCYGKMELLVADEVVLGLDVAKDISRDYSYWGATNVFALVPGPWMKELVEMAAHIDGTRARERQSDNDRDALRRASRIRLPE
jgi:hypothetical protein